ncbi:MAG TPA: hypothetical protein VLQ65_11025 [Saliniramus sp.]|nr:hypothetical protein [Saliniramus sp.]
MIEKPPPPSRPSPGESPARSEDLREDIDTGRTGDKVPFRDPAAAPLGADDEAAGHTPSSEEVALARAHETGTGGGTHPNATEQGRESFNAQGGRPWPFIFIGLAVVAIGAIIVAVLFGG